MEDARPIDSSLYKRLLILILSVIDDFSPCLPSRLVEALSRNTELARHIDQEFPGGVKGFVQSCLSLFRRGGLIIADGEAVVLTEEGKATTRRLREITSLGVSPTR